MKKLGKYLEFTMVLIGFVYITMYPICFNSLLEGVSQGAQTSLFMILVIAHCMIMKKYDAEFVADRMSGVFSSNYSYYNIVLFGILSCLQLLMLMTLADINIGYSSYQNYIFRVYIMIMSTKVLIDIPFIKLNSIYLPITEKDKTEKDFSECGAEAGMSIKRVADEYSKNLRNTEFDEMNEVYFEVDEIRDIEEIEI